MERIKHIYVLLLVGFICSCVARERTIAPPVVNHSDSIISNSTENTMESEVEAKETEKQYTFEYVGYYNKYFGLNDLSYFLADTSIKTIRLSGGTFSDLSPLVMLKDLEELQISINEYITDISPIGSLVKLKKLALSNYKEPESIEPISSLVNLQYLVLLCGGDRDFRELVPLQRLEVLLLWTVSDITYITQIHSLKELQLGIEKTTDIKLLGKLANLKKLSLNIFPEYEVVDLSWIPALHELRELSIRSSSVDDVSPLAELPKLTEIDFDRTKIKDISPLLKSKTLKKVTGFVLENDDTELRSLFEKRGIEYWKFSSDH